MKKGLIVHALLYNQKHEVLLIRRSLTDDILPGIWDIPGGTLDDGEDPKDGAMREVKEETGFRISKILVCFITPQTLTIQRILSLFGLSLSACATILR